MEEINLFAQKREATTKGKLRSFRKQGFIPAVYYGKQVNSIPLLVKAKEFMPVFHKIRGENVLINLQIVPDASVGTGGQTEKVIIKDYQVDPIKRRIIHLDFYKVLLKEKIETTVGIELTGECVGVKEGGILEQPIREVKVRCLPTQLPRHLEADISNLKIGDALRAEDLILGKGVEVLTEPRAVIAVVRAPVKVEEKPPEKPEEAEEKKEPEVIGKEKKPKEEEAVSPEKEKEKGEGKDSS